MKRKFPKRKVEILIYKHSSDILIYKHSSDILFNIILKMEMKKAIANKKLFSIFNYSCNAAKLNSSFQSKNQKQLIFSGLKETDDFADTYTMRTRNQLNF